MNLYLFQQINQFALRWLWLDTLGIYFAKYFEYVLVSSLFLFLAINFRKYLKMLIQAFLSAILARFVIVEFIRWLWQRPRPFTLLNFAEQNFGGLNVNLLLTHNSASFPSGHAAFFFALSTIVFLYHRKIGVLFYLGSFLISLARIFTGLHWPSDILVGVGIGILSGCLIYKISHK